MDTVWSFLERASGPVGAVALIIIVWKGASLAQWVKSAISHLRGTVDKIEEDFHEFRTENRDEHRDIRQEIAEVRKDCD